MIIMTGSAYALSVFHILERNSAGKHRVAKKGFSKWRLLCTKWKEINYISYGCICLWEVS